MPLNTVYQVRARQQWGSGGKELETVWFYDHTAGTGDSTDLAVAWGTGIGDAINDMQCSHVRNYSIDVINLGDLSDFDSVPWTGGGAIVQEANPPFAAVGFTMKVDTRAVRKGSKRISGIPETVVQNGVVTDSAYLALMETLRGAMQVEIVTGTDTFLPVVVKRIKTAVTGTVPLQYTYRLPTIGDPLTLGEIVVVLTSPNLTHQVSREV